MILRFRPNDVDPDELEARLWDNHLGSGVNRGIAPLQARVAADERHESGRATDTIHLDVAAAVRFGLERRRSADSFTPAGLALPHQPQ